MFKKSFNKVKHSLAALKPKNQVTRGLVLHEYQAAALFRKYGIPVPRGEVITDAKESLDAAHKLGNLHDYIVKAQVLSGGRGLGYFEPSGFKGGVQLCHTPEEVEEVASKMVGQTLVTKQTGAAGKPCNTLYVVERKYIRREIYFAILNDRSFGGPVIVASGKGGMSIEDVARDHPEEIFKVGVSITNGPNDDDLYPLCDQLRLPKETHDDAVALFRNAYKAFLENDTTLLEINPLALTSENEVMACDAKVSIDDNAKFRQGELFEQQDISQEDPREVHAAKFDLNYIHLDGNIGCMVNGAGLAMATMDIIKLNGGEPANFLDVGGSASETQVIEAFRILNDDTQVEAILVNIFGGIMRCDIIALGIIKATQILGMRKPLVVRLKGTNVDAAKELIGNSGLSMHFSDNLTHAAAKAVKMAEIMRMASEADLDIKFEL